MRKCFALLIKQEDHIAGRGSNATEAHVSNPKSKLVNTSGLQNQEAKGNHSQTAN